MKVFSALLALALAGSTLCAASSYAQSGMSIAYSRDILIGPMFTAGAAVSAGDVSQGLKTDARFAWSGGALGFFPLSENIAISLGLDYDARGVNFHNQGDVNSYVNTTYSYFSIRPEFKFKDFLIGLGIGIPTGGSQSFNGSFGSGGNISGSGTINSSDMNVLVEGRIGAAIELMRSETGALNLLIEGAYPFTKIYKDQQGVDNTKDNGPLATAQIGVSYMFDLHSNM